MNIFRIVSFIENIDIRLSGSVTLNEEFFRMMDIMNRLLGIFEPGNDLPVCIDGYRGFQESFSGLTGPPEII